MIPARFADPKEDETQRDHGGDSQSHPGVHAAQLPRPNPHARQHERHRQRARHPEGIGRALAGHPGKKRLTREVPHRQALHRRHVVPDRPAGRQDAGQGREGNGHPQVGQPAAQGAQVRHERLVGMAGGVARADFYPLAPERGRLGGNREAVGREEQALQGDEPGEALVDQLVLVFDFCPAEAVEFERVFAIRFPNGGRWFLGREAHRPEEVRTLRDFRR